MGAMFHNDSTGSAPITPCREFEHRIDDFTRSAHKAAPVLVAAEWAMIGEGFPTYCSNQVESAH